jgi:hypothetical protein
LYPSDIKLALKVDEMRELVEDMFARLKPCFFEPDEKIKQHLRQEYMSRWLPIFFDKIERQA